MPDMLHRIDVDRPPEDVYSALTTEAGLSGWWTANAEVEPREGTTALFGFGDRSTVFEMDIAGLSDAERVRWHCTGRPAEWTGTELTWDLSSDDGGTVVTFTHANWQSTTGAFRICNTTWGALLYRFKSVVESGNPDPLFSGRSD